MPSGEIFFLSLLLSLLPVSVPQYGCTVPTSRNYNASAALDDGSCICETRAEPRGDTCTPSSVVVSRREGEDLCPAARPLPCMMCDPSNKNCIYQCETADGLQCSKLGLETKLFISNEAVTKEINVALVVVLALLVTVSVCIHSLGWRWLQESMAWILVGMGLGLSVHLYAQLSAGTDTAEKFFEEHIEFKGWIFFYLLLPPIICDAGYHLKRSRFFRNIDRILMLSVVGTVISTIVIGATLYFVDLGVLPGIDASRGPGALNPGPWQCLQFGALLSATDPVASLSVLSSMAQLKDKDLTSVIFGEAIFNDATAIALFTVLQPVALSPYDLSAAGEETEAGQPAIVDQQSGWGMACQFVYVSFGSLAAGVLCGALSALITKHASSIGDKGPHVEVAVVLVTAYGSYVGAILVDLSGIISLFFTAIMLSHYTKHNLTPIAGDVTTSLFKTLAWMAEAFTFAYLGIDFVLGIDWPHINWSFVGLTAGACFLARGLTVVPCAVLLNWRDRFRYRANSGGGGGGGVGSSGGGGSMNTTASISSPVLGAPDRQRISSQSQAVLWWCGLRGPVAYGLAKKWRDESDDPTFHNVVSTTMVIVVLTTFLCGGTLSLFVRALGVEMDEDDIRQGLNETVESMSHTLIVPRDSHDVKLLDESSEASDGEHPLPTAARRHQTRRATLGNGVGGGFMGPPCTAPATPLSPFDRRLGSPPTTQDYNYLTQEHAVDLSSDGWGDHHPDIMPMPGQQEQRLHLRARIDEWLAQILIGPRQHLDGSDGYAEPAGEPDEPQRAADQHELNPVRTP